ncbi:MAG: alanine racemase [Mycoplasmoidaceae bacterium]|nr:MAG: alanine racemase [Mycoplasmoidaceae bacterium]
MLNLVINKKKIIQNFNLLNTFTKKYKYDNLFFVLKGNAYGLGINEITSILLEKKCTRFCVARMEEAMLIRKLSKTAEIILLSIIDDSDVAIAIKNNLYVSVSNTQQLKKYCTFGNKLKCQLVINSGMNRIGFKNKNEFVKSYNTLLKSKVNVVGVFSHIYDNFNKDKIIKQINIFNDFVKALPNWKNIKYRSIRASCGIDNLDIIQKSEVENTCRPGASLYGWDCGLDPKRYDNFNAIKLICDVKQINIVNVGETVGYDGTYTAKQDNEYIAVLPCGYGDGYLKNMKNGYVYIKNIKYPIVGKIAMDTMMVKVDKNVKQGDIAELIRDEKHISDILTPLENLDSYAVLSNLSVLRIKRIIK